MSQKKCDLRDFVMAKDDVEEPVPIEPAMDGEQKKPEGGPSRVDAMSAAASMSGEVSAAEVVEEHQKRLTDLVSPNLSEAAAGDAARALSMAEIVEEHQKRLSGLADPVTARMAAGDAGSVASFLSDMEESQRKWKHLGDLHTDMKGAAEIFATASASSGLIAPNIRDRIERADFARPDETYQKKQEAHQNALIDMLNKQVAELGESNRLGKETDEFARQTAAESSDRQARSDDLAKQSAREAFWIGIIGITLTIAVLGLTAFAYYFPRMPIPTPAEPVTSVDGLNSEKAIKESTDLAVIKPTPQPASEEIALPQPELIPAHAPADSAPPSSDQSGP